MNDLKTGGFNYDNCIRNKAMQENNIQGTGNMKYTKTGTTICGLVFKVSPTKSKHLICNFFEQDGVILGADTRATAGATVADPNCMKIHHLAPNIYCSGAGTAADCDHVTGKYLNELLF